MYACRKVKSDYVPKQHDLVDLYKVRACFLSHRSSVFKSLLLEISLAYLKQKDERSLSGNVQGRKFSVASCNKCSVIHCSPQLPYTILHDRTCVSRSLVHEKTHKSSYLGINSSSNSAKHRHLSSEVERGSFLKASVRFKTVSLMKWTQGGSTIQFGRVSVHLHQSLKEHSPAKKVRDVR